MNSSQAKILSSDDEENAMVDNSRICLEYKKKTYRHAPSQNFSSDILITELDVCIAIITQKEKLFHLIINVLARQN